VGFDLSVTSRLHWCLHQYCPAIRSRRYSDVSGSCSAGGWHSGLVVWKGMIKNVPNKALHLTAIPLRSIAAGELAR